MKNYNYLLIIEPQEDLKITLDCVQVGFLEEDTLVLSLKGGELYVLTLLADSMRYIRSFHFEKAAASVLTTCISICENNFLFLGSRLGNSLLLRFTEQANEVITLDDNDEPSSKRIRDDRADKALDSLTDCMASDVMDIRDPEELEVYGTQKQAGVPVRFWIACMVFFTTFTCYTTRVNLSVSIVSMTKGKTKGIPYCKKSEGSDNDGTGDNQTTQLPDYGPRYEWDERVQGSLLGAYFYGYIFTNLAAGLIAEHFGPLKVIVLVHIVATIANTLSVLAATVHWSLLFVCRFVLGMGGALVYPALQVLIAFWAPPQEKGKFISALMGNVLGTCVTWPTVGLVTTYLGWNWGFYVVSITNVIFCIVFSFLVTDSPDTHKWIKPEEADFIKESQAGSVTKKKVIAPYKKMFSNIPYWMLMLCHFGNEWGLYLQLTLVPKFISDVIGFDLSQAGGLSALPPLMRMTFGLVLGAIADELLKREIFRKVVVRKSYTILSHILPGLMLIAISFVGCNWIPVIILLTFSLGMNGACVQNILINAQDLAPNFSGTIYAINSFFAGMTGFIVPALNGEFTREHNGIKEWSYTFIIGGIVYCIGGVVWILFGSVEEQSFNRFGDPGS